MGELAVEVEEVAAVVAVVSTAFDVLVIGPGVTGACVEPVCS